MAKKMLIDATHPEETRVVVADGTRVDDFDFETLNKRQLAGNIYLAKVTRVEPSLQAAFVDYGGNRHGFLAFAEIHPDYYQIPAADRRALIEEDRAAAEAEEEDSAQERRPRNTRSRSRGGREERAERASQDDAVTKSDAVPGMEVIDASTEQPSAEDAAVESGFSAAGGDAVDPSVEGQGGDANAPEPTPVDAPERAEAQAEAGDSDDDHAEDSGSDDEIESVAEEDVAEEIRPARKPRARRYKIQEVIKVRQIMLVQVVKEERGNKGAALTTYLSLAGRYCVLMPNTARGGGISRKITNVADRKKLKDIAAQLEVPQGAGLIIRTAGSQRTQTEIKRDYEYLMRLWEQIRELTFKSVAPAPIYEEGDLIKRTIRDLYSKDIDEVLVEGERGYCTARDFMAMIMPSQVRAVKHYTDPMPLFTRHGVESYLSGMFNPTVQLKSGGYIVIGITEALVAIDVNSGRATKEGSIEDTAFKTNCEAADEIARQLRLRDLAGLIVIDFIDMDERKNNAAVEKRFKDALKNDRARIQVGRISGFGLMEMSRQRLRPGMLESTTQQCPHCHGTGLIRSDDSMALTILRAIEEEGTRKRSREVLVKAPVAVANYLMNQKREHIATMEARYGLSVRVEADPGLISPDYTLEKFKTATRAVPEPSSAALSVDARLMAQIDEHEDAAEEEIEAEIETEADESAAHEVVEDENGNGSRRRRRRRRRGGRNGDEANDEQHPEDDGEADAEIAEDESGNVEDEAGGDSKPAGSSRSRRSRSRSRRRVEDRGEASGETTGGIIDESRDVPAGAGEPVETGGIPANADGLGDDAEEDAQEADGSAHAPEGAMIEASRASGEEPAREAAEPQAGSVQPQDAGEEAAPVAASDQAVAEADPVLEDAGAQQGEAAAEAIPDERAGEAAMADVAGPATEAEGSPADEAAAGKDTDSPASAVDNAEEYRPEAEPAGTEASGAEAAEGASEAEVAQLEPRAEAATIDEPAAEAEPQPARPKRRGWWSN
ncbi:ribonuclease E/G [Paracoccus sp. MC1862]|uniref:ribonuclease E/G n=1 Tax=Paracoccus sp. MC1862 TaxID=2760307 RepID=UPI0015FFD883|nr:ribonuclease E/G [Paracoccus sp. MC1862]MBB1497539.1 Rne/Rng family ribonuclease [Paracoccus sp. MC1862]QQO43988.1 Rne/Rng family ribonuclease [Paracoccus sp. MC1862]